MVIPAGVAGNLPDRVGKLRVTPPLGRRPDFKNGAKPEGSDHLLLVSGYLVN
jgi:hypothetical protein